jgi:tetratricopeptide (TPR) repeat protein
MKADWMSKEGIVISSVIVFFLLLILYFIGPLNDYWTSGDNEFRNYALILFVVFLLFTAAGIYLLVTTKLWILKWEARGFGIFLIGSILLFIIPFGNATEILPGGMEMFGAIQVILLIIGILICLVGALLLARDGGFFSIWFLGVVFMLVLGGHEAFRIIIYTGDYGPIDTFLRYEALGILLTSFVLFVVFEVKNLYIFYLFDEALEHKRDNDLEMAVEILDKALRLAPRHTTALNNKGNILYKLKEFEGARECYQGALDANPDYHKAEDNLRVVNKALGIRETF